MAVAPEQLSSDWRRRVLGRLGAPINNVTLLAMGSWAASEGVNPRYYNWLGTTINCCGGRAVNSVGVKAFPNLAAGVEATVRTLRLSYYTSIVAALRAGRDLGRIWRAINRSPWCGPTCQEGKYPIALFNVLSDPQRVRHPPPPLPKNQDIKDNDWSKKIRRAGDHFVRGSPRIKKAGRAMRQAARR